MRLLFIIAFLISVGMVSGQSIVQSEILSRPTDKSVSVRLFFDSKTEIFAQYGTTSQALNQNTATKTIEANEPCDIVIDNLTPNTRYYYRIAYRSPANGDWKYRPVYTFHTQRALGSSYTFVVQADPHLDEQSDTAVYRRCLQNQLDDQPDFIIDMGDIIMTDKLKMQMVRSQKIRSLVDANIHGHFMKRRVTPHLCLSPWATMKVRQAGY
ncbi:MAG: hypothetical protein IPJ39_01855 [Saprospiraceae bacterium]|nr:hypothetical protein [Saprospiraceae bacterium]